jgi:hypothetical protein
MFAAHALGDFRAGAAYGLSLTATNADTQRPTVQFTVVGAHIWTIDFANVHGELAVPAGTVASADQQTCNGGIFAA